MPATATSTSRTNWTCAARGFLRADFTSARQRRPKARKAAEIGREQNAVHPEHVARFVVFEGVAALVTASK